MFHEFSWLLQMIIYNIINTFYCKINIQNFFVESLDNSYSTFKDIFCIFYFEIIIDLNSHALTLILPCSLYWAFNETQWSIFCCTTLPPEIRSENIKMLVFEIRCRDSTYLHSWPFYWKFWMKSGNEFMLDRQIDNLDACWYIFYGVEISGSPSHKFSSWFFPPLNSFFQFNFSTIPT